MTQRFVVDSSVILKWLNTVDEKYVENADRILSEAIKGKIELLAPELAKYEIGNTLLYSKKLSIPESATPLHALFEFPIQFIAESELLAKETFLIAKQLKITYYDACFLSLTKQYDATLITENVKHQGKSADILIKALKDV